MAINFGDTIMEGSIEPSVQVQNPVQDNSGAVLAEALRPAAAAVGQIAGSIFKGQQEDANGKILSQYENDLLDLADAVDQGAMDRNEAMIKARNLRRQYLANAPALQDDFDTVWTDFAGANGLGHVVIQGTQEQQMQDEFNQKAFQEGFDSPEAYRQSLIDGQAVVESTRRLTLLQNEGATITQTQLNQHLNVVTQWATNAYPVAQRQVNEAMAAIEANPENKAAIAENLNFIMGQTIAQVQQMGGPADSTYITKPLETLMTTFNDYVNGTVSNAVLEGQLKTTQNIYDLMYATDPVFGPRIAASRVLSSVNMQEQGYSMWDPDSVKVLVELGEGKISILNTDTATQRTLENIAFEAGNLTTASDPEKVTEVGNYINQMINNAYKFERSTEEGALSYAALVNTLGRPEISAYIAQFGIDAEHANQLTTVLKNNYENELLPVIDRAWTAPFPLQNPAGSERVVPNNIPLNQLIEPRWNGNAVEFVPKAEYARDARVIQLANDTTSGDNSIGIPLNNLINTYANVTGVDPKQIYEEDFAGRLFGVSEDGEEASVADKVNSALDATDPENFSLGDFNPDTLEPIEEYTSQSSSLTSVLPPIDPAYTDVEGIDYDDYLPSIRASESGGNDSATNPSSTATGRYQFLKSTWDGLVNRYPNAGLTFDGRLDPQQQEVAIRLFTAENARMLKNNSVPLNNGTLYAAHFLGAGDAVKVLKANPSDMVSAYVPARVINANKFLRDWTVAQFKAWANRKGNA